MERVNKKYVKLNKLDLLFFECNGIKCDQVSQLLSSIYDYESNNNYVGDFYLCVDGFFYDSLSKVLNFNIKRDSILNAFVYAGYTKDLQMLFCLNSFVSYNEVSISELGNVASYVLEHSINFNEYLDGQEKKLIFDEVSNSFYEDYIYDFNKYKKKIIL